LLVMLGGEFSNLVVLVDSFLADTPQLLAELKRFIDADDTDGVRRIAHSLKSNGADFGAVHFTGLCKELELIGKNGSLVGAVDLYLQIASEYEKVAAALKAVPETGIIPTA
jgi:HPt (histidine-containing phosphotransfer) domain-containing protein